MGLDAECFISWCWLRAAVGKGRAVLERVRPACVPLREIAFDWCRTTALDHEGGPLRAASGRARRLEAQVEAPADQIALVVRLPSVWGVG